MRPAMQTLPTVQSRSPRPDRKAGNLLRTELAKAASVIRSSKIPSESDLLKALGTCERLAKSMCAQDEMQQDVKESLRTPTSKLLTLEEDGETRKTDLSADESLRSSTPDSRDLWAREIEGTLQEIVTDKNTFMTAEILRVYVRVLAILERPKSFPRIFDLYTSKPVPVEGSSPIIYREPNPSSIKAAVPLDIARQALDAAIATKNLALCMSVLSTTVGTTAFRRNKIVRRASLPALLLSLTPWASHEMALAYMEHSPRSDPDYAFYLPFLSFMTFFGMSSVTFYLTCTTSFVMDRVTWRPATALYQRWTREEERAFADKIAQAWGFQANHKRGEEEGKDWANLREWLYERRMDLDRVDRLEGME